MVSQRSRDEPSGNSSNAFLAPVAMESSCAATRSIRVWSDVESRSQELTVRYALASVHWAFITLIWAPIGLVSYIPEVRCLAAMLSEGPWMYKTDPPSGSSAAIWLP